MKIAFLTIKIKNKDGKISQNKYQKLNFIIKDKRFTIIYLKHIKNYNLKNFDIIINDTHANLNFYNKNIISAKICGDIKLYRNNPSLNFTSKFNFLIAPYKKYYLNDYTIFKNKNKFYLPHHYDLNIFKNYNLKKIYDIVIYGSCEKSVYPFRHRIKELLIKNNKLFKIKYIKFPGYNPILKSNMIVNENLSKIINQSYLTLCTPSKDDILLKKYGETCLSYSCVLGNIPLESKKLFKKNYVKINNNMTDEKIIKIIKEHLKDKNKILIKTKNMHEIFKQNYDYETYTNKLYNICEKYKSNYKK